MTRVFWDTNLFIYLIEDFGTLSKRVVAMRERMLARGDQLLTSAMTLGEILVKPAEAGRADLCRAYTEALTNGAILLPFDARVAPLYARVRGDRTIRPPDAVQLACAAQAGVDLFVTNDARLSKKSVPGIHFITALDAAPL